MTIIRLLRRSAAGWWNDRCLSLGAALSFYTIFSLAPVLLMAISIAGLVFGQDAARGAIVHEIGGMIGTEPAKALQAMLSNTAHFGSGVLATAIGTVTFFVLATGAIVELQDDLHQIWKVEPEHSTFTALIRSRFLSLSLVVSIGFLLLVSLSINAGLTALSDYVAARLPAASAIIYLINFGFSLIASTALFTVIFKLLPEIRIAWWDVFVGALLTALLFELGKFLIGLYIGASGVASTYGAAGSLVTILLWIYYSSQILLFGAEFIKAYAEHRAGPSHDPHAVGADAPPPPDDEADGSSEDPSGARAA